MVRKNVRNIFFNYHLIIYEIANLFPDMFYTHLS